MVSGSSRYKNGKIEQTQEIKKHFLPKDISEHEPCSDKNIYKSNGGDK
jgi:hypothetical protein